MNSSRLLQDIKMQPESLARVLDYQLGEGRRAILKSAELIRHARRVVITGMGASLYASIPFEYFLSSLGIHAVAIESAELLHYRECDCSGAVVLMVSRSGDSVEVVRLLPKLKGAATTIGVTNESGSALAHAADSLVLVGSLPDEMIAIQSHTGTLLTLALLGAAVANALDSMRITLTPLLASLPAFIEANVSRLADWDEFLEAGSPVHLLGRGPSCGSAFAGAQLFNETAKAPAVGMPAGSFRHGPVELVDERFRGLIFAPAGRTRDLNAALARDLVRFHGQVRVIGPPGSDLGDLLLYETPPVPDGLAPLVEIVPVQLAALRLAQLRGLTAGKFRYVAQVTRDEATFTPPAR